MRAFTQHLLCRRPSSESGEGCGNALTFNFPDVVNGANIFIAGVESLAILRCVHSEYAEYLIRHTESLHEYTIVCDENIYELVT